MYDSTSPGDIPRDAEMVAGYVDGRYAWPQEWWDMFPNSVHVKISAIGAKTSPVGDVEVGCIWPPANAVPWVLRARADGYDPTIYVNEVNDWGPTRAAFQRAGVPEPHWWVANYDGREVIPAGAVAKQFAHPDDGDGVDEGPHETGKHYDESIVADFWPGVDGEDDMALDAVRDYQALKTMMQRFYTYEARPGGAEPKWENGPTIYEQLGSITAMLAAVANDQDITPDAMNRMVDEAVAKHTAKAEDVAKALAPEVAREVVALLPRNEDGSLQVDVNEEQIAAEVINLAGRKLGAA
jgi:hypothetical protein